MKKKLLLIEDNPLLITMYETAFESSGFEVVSATDGKTGIARAKEEKPDVVVLDLLMPGIDGYTVLGELKKDKATKKAKAVILTAMVEKKEEEKGRLLGADEFLAKSELTLSQIVERISALAHS